MARFQIQIHKRGSNMWIDKSTLAPCQRDRNLAIAFAEIHEMEAMIFGQPVAVRVVRVGRWTGNSMEVVWPTAH